MPNTIGEPVLEVKDLVGEELPRGVSLTLHKGEILGIAGIVGAGRTELLRSIFGLDSIRSGSVIIRTERHRTAMSFGSDERSRYDLGTATRCGCADAVLRREPQDCGRRESSLDRVSERDGDERRTRVGRLRPGIPCRGVARGR